MRVISSGLKSQEWQSLGWKWINIVILAYFESSPTHLNRWKCLKPTFLEVFRSEPSSPHILKSLFPTKWGGDPSNLYKVQEGKYAIATLNCYFSPCKACTELFNSAFESVDQLVQFHETKNEGFKPHMDRKPQLVKPYDWGIYPSKAGKYAIFLNIVFLWVYFCSYQRYRGYYYMVG